jgi:hypothetical protein
LNFNQAFTRYSFAQIRYRNMNAFCLDEQPNLGSFASRMAVDVCKTLLHQSEDCKFHIARQPSDVLGNVQQDGNAAAFPKALHIPVES